MKRKGLSSTGVGPGARIPHSLWLLPPSVTWGLAGQVSGTLLTRHRVYPLTGLCRSDELM